MPNHVTNQLTILEGDREAVWAAIKGKQELIDFEAVVPMPPVVPRGGVSETLIELANLICGKLPLAKWLGTTGPSGPESAEAFKRGDFSVGIDMLGRSNLIRTLTETQLAADLIDKDFKTLIACMQSIRETGYPTWYGWCTEHWGTKWNAYEQKRLSPDAIQFETAWSPPLKIWAAITKKFPSHRFLIEWADEDFGSNVGSLTIQGADVVGGEPTENRTPEAYRVAVRILYDGKLPECYQWADDGRAEYLEELDV